MVRFLSWWLNAATIREMLPAGQYIASDWPAFFFVLRNLLLGFFLSPFAPFAVHEFVQPRSQVILRVQHFVSGAHAPGAIDTARFGHDVNVGPTGLEHGHAKNAAGVSVGAQRDFNQGVGAAFIPAAVFQRGSDGGDQLVFGLGLVSQAGISLMLLPPPTRT